MYRMFPLNSIVTSLTDRLLWSSLSNLKMHNTFFLFCLIKLFIIGCKMKILSFIEPSFPEPPPPHPHNCRKGSKKNIFSCFGLNWPCCDFEMTLPWPCDNNPVKYSPIWSCSHRLGLITCNQCILANGQNIKSVCYLDHYCHIRQYWHKDDLMWGGRKNPPTLMLSLLPLFGILVYLRVGI